MGDRDLDKNVTGCHFPSSIDCWDKTAPVAKSELSASMQYGLELSGRVRIGAEIILSQRLSKAICSSKDQWNTESAFVKSKRGQAIWENPSINL